MNRSARAFLNLSLFILTALSAGAQGTAFNYQGRLMDSGNPATGLYDLTFSLHDASSGGAPQGNTLTNLATPVTNGLFSVTLDFSNQFPGAARWLELAVRTNGGAAFSTLVPREQILATPYAIQSLNAESATVASSANSVLAGNISGTIGLAQLPASVLTNGASGVSITGTFSGSGSGLAGLNPANLSAGTANINISGNAATATSALSASSATAAGSFTGSLAGDVTGPQGATVVSANILRLNGTNVLTGTNTFAGVMFATNTSNQISGAFTGNGSALTGLNASQITSGAIALSQLPTSVLTNSASGVNISGTFSGNGSGLAGLNPANLSAGTANINISGNAASATSALSASSATTAGSFTGSLAGDVTGSQGATVVSANILRLNGTNVLTGTNTFTGVMLATNTNNQISGTFIGNGIGLSNLSVDAGHLTGTIAFSQLPSTVLTNGASGISLSGSISGNGVGITNLDLANNSQGAISFGVSFTSSFLPVGNAPQSVIAVDVNGDGKMDLVAANFNDGNLTIYTNNGNGGFAVSGTPGVGVNPRTLVSADVNGDGKPDLISANFSGNNLTILTNDGFGGFAVASSPGVGRNPGAVTAADVNGDGKPDLISADFGASTVTVLTNNGSGAFVRSATIPVGNNPFWVAAADVNGDGKVDLITANEADNTLTILTNNGFGGFALASSPSVGRQPYCVVAVDVNGDGKLDLVSANYGDNTLSVLTNNGSGGFALASSPAAGSTPYAVTAADIDGDGKPDLISANFGNSTLSVLLNRGNGQFVLAASPTTGYEPVSVAAADLNGDGKLDLICANYLHIDGDDDEGNTLTVFLNNTGYFFTGIGSGLTGLNPANLSAGAANINISGNAATAATAGNFTGLLAGDVTGPQGATVVSANFPRFNGTNAFTGTNSFAGIMLATNTNNVISGAFTGDGSGLTGLNPANLSAGVANINISGNAATATSTLSASSATTAGSFTGSLAGDVTGPQGATVVSANFPRLNGTNFFIGTNSFVGVMLATNTNNVMSGAFTGDGSGLTSLNGSQITSGTIALSQLAAAVLTNGESGLNVSGIFSGAGSGLTNVVALNLVTNSTYATNGFATGFATNVYSANGTYNFTVPANAGRMVVKLWGAGGASGSAGAYAQVTRNVTPGDTYVAVVGQSGNGLTGGGSGLGDAAGGNGINVSGGGGQGSSVFLFNAGTSHYIMKAVAGGGGGLGTLGSTGGVSGSTGGFYSANALTTGEANLSLMGGVGQAGSQFGVSPFFGYSGGGGGGFGGGLAGAGGGSYGDITTGAAGSTPGNSDPYYLAGSAMGNHDGLVVVLFYSLAPLTYVPQTVQAISFNGDGSALTSLNASQLASGTVPFARLPAGVLTNGESGVTLAGNFTGNGGGLTNLNGANVTPGSVGAAQLAAGVLAPAVNAGGSTTQATANTVYNATNSSQTLFFLPTNANVGDVVQINGSGSGGWQVSGAMSAVFAGTNWTAQNSGSQNWQGIASSSNGTKLAAVVLGGQISTSTDSGMTWTPRGSALNWLCVASSADGAKLIAGTYLGYLYTSTDGGATWTQRDTSTVWMGVASSADGTKLAAVYALAGSGAIHTSTDSGVTWTSRIGGQLFHCIASSADGSKLVAGVGGGTGINPSWRIRGG